MLQTRLAGLMVGLIDGLVLFMVTTVALRSCDKRVELPFDKILNEFRVFLRSWRTVILLQ